LEAIARDESSDDIEAQPKKFLGKHARSDSKYGSTPDSSHPSQGGTDAAFEPESTNASYRRRTASIDQSNADSKLQRKDKYGVAIPRFSQVGESLATLGVGRCGKVTKVAWNGGYAALKEFSFRFTDEEEIRHFFSTCTKKSYMFLSVSESCGAPTCLLSCFISHGRPVHTLDCSLASKSRRTIFLVGQKKTKKWSMKQSQE
jgi:hypothetical protein